MILACVGTQTDIQDPSVKPPGYEPPTTADELQERYAAGERYFVGTKLRGANLRGMVLRGSNLDESDFVRASLQDADLAHVLLRTSGLSGANLAGADLTGADLTGARVAQAVLRNATLTDALLEYALMRDSDLGDAEVAGAVLMAADLRGTSVSLGQLAVANVARAIFDHKTVERNKWSRDEVRQALSHGAIPDDAPAFIVELIELEGEGLTLYFSTKVTPVDRFLVDGTIYGILGFGSDCRIVEFQEREDSAVVRLQASNPQDLVTVADALHERAWEAEERAHTVALQRLDKVFQLDVMGAAFGSMADKIDKMELRLPSEAAVERQNDLGDGHVLDKDKELLRTRGQTVLAAVWETGKKLVGKAFVKVVTGGVVDALPLPEEHE